MLGTEGQALSNGAAGKDSAAWLLEIAGASWQKSSWSAANGNCVAIMRCKDGRVGIRDTKDRGTGPVLIFARSDWDAFLLSAKNGEFGSG